MSTTATARAAVGRRLPRTRRGKGIALVAVMAAVLVALTFKNNITLFLRSGETINATFSQDYDIVPGHTRVKMAGLQVGVVSGMHQDNDGTAHVSMKVDDRVVKLLGANPSARIEPLTILGGEYAVELQPSGSGSFSGTIPVNRTHTPVELDRILSALPSPTRHALQQTVTEAGAAFGPNGAKALQGLAKESTVVMKPAGTLVSAARGTKPSTDIPTIVGQVSRMAGAFDSQTPALGRSLDNLDRTTAVLARRSPDLSRAIGNLPEALDATAAGTRDLRSTLDKLGSTASRLHPTAKALRPLLGALEPTLRETLPVARQLPSLLRNARPLVRQLVPIASSADRIVNDVKGPVIKRVDGPILFSLGHTYRGTGAFKDTGRGVQANNKFFQEIAYMATNLDRASQTHDAQGSLLNFQAGVSAGSLAPLNLDDALAALLPIVQGN